MGSLKYAIALPMTLVSFSAWAWDALTPQEAFARCYSGDVYACEVAQAYQQYEEDYYRRFNDPYNAPSPRSPADQWVSPEELWLEKPGPFSPGELAR